MNDELNPAPLAEPAPRTVAPEEEQQHPTTGGSYIRYPDTGKIQQVDGPTDDEQE